MIGPKNCSSHDETGKCSRCDDGWVVQDYECAEEAQNVNGCTDDNCNDCIEGYVQANGNCKKPQHCTSVSWGYC